MSTPLCIVVCMQDAELHSKTAWAVNACSWRAAARLSQELGIPHVAAMVLAGRGVTDTEVAREFLECSFTLPDPFLFADMKGAVTAIAAAADQGSKIVVHGDYDADGITATALLVLGLRAQGAVVDWYLPSRFREGYGLSNTAVESVAAGGAALLITVDCGVNYPEQVALAKRLGLEVVVVDHHQPGPELPACHLIHHVRGEYPHNDLCGVGLALKVLHALHIHRTGSGQEILPPGLSAALDLVAIGTIADLTPLRGENRYYVREGLRLLNLGQRVGLRALAEVASCAGAVDSGSVAFRLAPRLNAAGRLADPSPPLRLLLADDEGEARALAGELHELNSARQDLERIMFETATRQVESLETLPTVIVLASPDWHEGVVGIVASRLVELFQRPTVLLGVRDGVAKGSGRSIPAFDLLGGLTACSSLLSIFGGHAQAAGLTLPAENVEAFRLALQQHAGAVLAPSALVPRYRADAVLSAEELNAETALALASFEPFGCGNPRPRFLLVDTTLENVERTRNGLHVKCQARVGGVKIPAIGFGMGRDAQPSADGGSYLAGAQLKADEWRGSIRAQLVLERVTPFFGSDVERCVGKWPDGVDGTDANEEYEQECDADAESHDRRHGGAWPDSARDLRGHAGRLTSVAQVMAAHERVALVTVSAPHAAALLGASLPTEVFDIEGTAYADALSSRRVADVLAAKDSALVEWDALRIVEHSLREWPHVIVLDPAYREDHVRSVAHLAEAGAQVHLMYGESEKRETASLLRYIVHPRFAMVCMYRALQQATNTGEGLHVAAMRIAWNEGHVLLGRSQLVKAEEILRQLGVERESVGKAKLETSQNAAFRHAEAEYEECVRLCQSL